MKKLVERKKRIDFRPTFPYIIDVICSSDYSQSFQKWVGGASGNSAAATLKGEQASLMLLPDKAPVEHVVHECSHAVFNLMASCGMTIVEDDPNETFCYLLQSLVQRTIKFQKRK